MSQKSFRVCAAALISRSDSRPLPSPVRPNSVESVVVFLCLYHLLMSRMTPDCHKKSSSEIPLQVHWSVASCCPKVKVEAQSREEDVVETLAVSEISREYPTPYSPHGGTRSSGLL